MDSGAVHPIQGSHPCCLNQPGAEGAGSPRAAHTRAAPAQAGWVWWWQRALEKGLVEEQGVSVRISDFIGAVFHDGSLTSSLF